MLPSIEGSKRSLPALILSLTALAILIATSAWMLVQSREREHLLRDHVQSEQTVAETGAAGIAAILDGFSSDLDRLSRLPSVRYLDRPERLRRTLDSFLDRTSVPAVALVRVDTTGKILLVYPDGGLPEEATDALRASGYLARAGASETRLLSEPIRVRGGQDLVAFSDLIQPDEMDPLGAIIAFFPASFLVGPIEPSAQSGGRWAVLRNAEGTVLHQAGMESTGGMGTAARQASDRFLAQAAVASEVEPRLGLELWSTREVALAPLRERFASELFFLLLMNGVIGIGGLFLARELWLRRRLGESIERRSELERRLSESQKLESIGRLAGGIAHDFNNALTVIQGSARLLEERLDHAPDREEVSAILQASGYAADLTRQLLAFARRQTHRPRLIELGGALRRIEPMLRRMLPADVVVSIETRSQGSWIHIDPIHFEQVILNLAANARDAMPQGGDLRISVGDLVATEEAIGDGPEPGPYFRVIVSDSGAGISPDALSRIFEPFFTTKPAAHGTGLGLATVYGIVKQSGGHVRVESSVGEGTRFILDFPAVEAPESGEQEHVGEREVAEPGGAPAPKDVTILLVEDNASVRRIAERSLARCGYRILLAESAEEALRIISDPARRIDLLLTDVVMPGLNGAELARRFVATRSGTPVLLMSGYTENEILQRGVAGTGAGFLEKPFTPDDLVRGVETALAEPHLPVLTPARATSTPRTAGSTTDG